MQNNKEIKCRICGKTDSLDRLNKCNETKIMEKENVCFHCAFWIDKIATTNVNTVIVNGIRYSSVKYRKIF